VWAGTAGAQQLVTDPASLPLEHTCRLAAWHGQRSSWAVPSCHVLPVLDLALGGGLVEDVDGQARRGVYSFRAKAVFASLGESPIGLGLAFGVGQDRQGMATGSGPRGVFAYIPFGLELAKGRVYLHLNGGWRYERTGLGPAVPPGQGVVLGTGSVATWAARLDVTPLRWLAVSGEAFGDTTGAGAWQAALGVQAIEEWLRVTGSWGTTLQGTLRPGWTVGVLLTPPPLW
jgi:hypothetical protein